MGFAEFAQSWGFKHTTSSPHYPQSNAAAKRITSQSDPFKALLAYHASPLQATGLKYRVPQSREKHLPSPVDTSIMRERDNAYKEKLAYFYERKHGTRETQPFVPGEQVRRVRTDTEKSWQTTGTVTKQVAPRSYSVHRSRNIQTNRETHHVRHECKAIFFKHVSKTATAATG